MKIRTAIFGVYVVASAIGLAVLMAFVLWEVRLRYVESMRRTLNDTAGLLAVMLEAEPAPGEGAFDPGAVWRKNQPALEQASSMLRVYVTDEHGIVVFDAHGGRDVGRDYTLRPEMIAYFQKAYGAPQNAGVVDGELRVTAPVRRNGTVVGFVGVGRSFSSVTAAVLRARIRLVVAAAVIALVMMAAGWWIAQKLAHSLERLTVHAEAVRDGRPSTPPASRAEEVAALTRAFEEMRATLEGKAHVERYTQALAHELKAPLTSIRGAAELLDEEMPRAERERFIANLRTESERLQRIVDRLLELAALEARREGAALQDVELAGLLAEITQSATIVVAQKKITLTSSVEGALRVRGDRSLLSQAVSNLVQNAWEFTPEGGRMAVNGFLREGRACVTVEDDGPGVPDYALTKIFDRFYSLPRPDTGRKSSGLGLSIVREIARLHRGEITLENRREGGVRATLTLPLGGRAGPLGPPD